LILRKAVIQYHVYDFVIVTTGRSEFDEMPPLAKHAAVSIHHLGQDDKRSGDVGNYKYEVISLSEKLSKAEYDLRVNFAIPKGTKLSAGLNLVEVNLDGLPGVKQIERDEAAPRPEMTPNKPNRPAAPTADGVTTKQPDDDHGLYATNLIFNAPSDMTEGHVRSQDLNTNSVTVNLGTAQGVKVGYVFQVFRQTDDGNGVKGIIGAIKVTDVQKTTSTAEVLSKQFVDEFKSTDGVRPPLFYSRKSGKVHIHISVTEEKREQVAWLERTFAPLQSLIGSKGLITIGVGAIKDCRVSIHPPTKYDPEFIQPIVDYLQTQKEIDFKQVIVVPLEQSSADSMSSGDTAAGVPFGSSGQASGSGLEP
jgi:hypothetical protein